MNSNIIEITLDNFQQIIVEQSKEKLILVSFWAEQIPESIELKDKLTTKTAAFDEHVILATVDCQTQGQIAQQFGIQGLPTAVLIKDSQPVDGLSGPQTDENIEEFLGKHLPKPQDILLKQAVEALADNNLSEANTAICKAYTLDTEQNGNRADIKLVLTDVYIQLGKIADAQALLDTIKMVDQDAYYKSLIAKLELASQAANSPEIQALEQELQDNSQDANLIHQLSAQYSQVNRNEEALALLFRHVQQASNDESQAKAKSKELLLDILKSLPDGDPLANKYRRKLYTLMY
ncbi:co-chaperone YbbN [Litorilituus lipolyticus]|uniref:co-chaperone YbbN n=1 Tax=Litorilituus lipolyticus TaxID=2491017 RepID=UPI001FE31C23|nr:tetratricopeptide repeat protein [Litorilituus lipolyticus]